MRETIIMLSVRITRGIYIIAMIYNAKHIYKKQHINLKNFPVYMKMVRKLIFRKRCYSCSMNFKFFLRHVETVYKQKQTWFVNPKLPVVLFWRPIIVYLMTLMTSLPSSICCFKAVETF